MNSLNKCLWYACLHALIYYCAGPEDCIVAGHYDHRLWTGFIKQSRVGITPVRVSFRD